MSSTNLSRAEIPGVNRLHDPMRRFAPTPYCSSLAVMGRAVRLESNSSQLVQHVTELFSGYPAVQNEVPVFRWRIVIEPDAQDRRCWPRRFAFSDGGLRFVQFGQRNFLMVDLQKREAVGFLSEKLMENTLGLTSPFLDNLFCLSAGSLGLVPLWANCVTRENRGVLLFGESGSGKTTASFLAEQIGLEFKADEGVFADFDCGVLRGWAGFWPPTFRPESLEFIPELKERTEPCSHDGFIVRHVVRRRSRITCLSPVQPICCLFLHRETSQAPVLSPLAPGKLATLLEGSILFEDDTRFLEQRSRVLHALEKLPAYSLRYGSDPAIAAATVRDLLLAGDFAESGRTVPAAQNSLLASQPAYVRD